MSAWSYMDCYSHAAKILGIKVLGSTDITLSDGDIIHAELHFPDFGNTKGTLVVVPAASAYLLANKATKSGYSISSFDLEPVGLVCAASDLAEMLSDWGWRGDPKEKPNWMKEIKS